MGFIWETIRGDEKKAHSCYVYAFKEVQTKEKLHMVEKVGQNETPMK